jgi:SnoaL-like domain
VLDELLAKQQITEVLYRYCRAMDRMDRELAKTIWSPGGTADYGISVFQGLGEDFLDYVWGQHAALDRHSHQITNILIEVRGDHADSEAYVTAALRTVRSAAPQVDIEVRGRYIDHWVRHDSRWMIEHREFVDDFTNTRPVADSPMTDTSAAKSRRDSSDPSYRALSA